VIPMDYTRLLGDSFDYTKEALWGRWTRWLLLLVSTIIFPDTVAVDEREDDRADEQEEPAGPPAPEGLLRVVEGVAE